MSIEQKILAFYHLDFRRKFFLFLLIPLSLYSYIILRFFKKNAKFGKIRPKNMENRVINMDLIKDISFAIRIISKHTILLGRMSVGIKPIKLCYFVDFIRYHIRFLSVLRKTMKAKSKVTLGRL